MDIKRLPISQTEKPALFGMYDREKNRVVWALDGVVFYDSPQFMDGSNWFSVWRMNDTIHCRATQWYQSRGDFCIRVTDLTPDEAVAMASQAADIASDYLEGDRKLENKS